MAKKKTDVFTCVHCSKDFVMPLRWCPRCEDHFLRDGFLLGKDVCDRCYNGLNDDYLKRKKGSPARVAKALAEIHKKHGPWVLTPMALKLETAVINEPSFYNVPDAASGLDSSFDDLTGRQAYYDTDIRD